MGIRSAFKRMIGKTPKSFSEVNQITTRCFSIPELDDAYAYVRFSAQLGKNGMWNINVELSEPNYISKFDGYKMCFAAAATAIQTYISENKLNRSIMFNKQTTMDNAFWLVRTVDFDTAFLTLKRLEQSFQEYEQSEPYPVNGDHFSCIYRILPIAFQQALDESYENHPLKTPLLPPKSGLPSKGRSVIEIASYGMRSWRNW